MAQDISEITAELLAGWALPDVATGADKEDRGHAVVIAGSRQIPGAALLCATAALRAGAGKVTLMTAASVAIALAIAVPEARVIGLVENAAGGLAFAEVQLLRDCLEQATAVLIGPGLADALSTCEVVERVLRETAGIPLVLDAIAMEIVRRDDSKAAFQASERQILITPHVGEMAHLTGEEKSLILEQPLQAASRIARRAQVLTVLKGAKTYVVTPHGKAWRHSADTPGLAVSGSGDVLAGVLAGLLARGVPPEQAAVWAVALHSSAGKSLAQKIALVGYLPRELLEEIPLLMGARP